MKSIRPLRGALKSLAIVLTAAGCFQGQAQSSRLETPSHLTVGTAHPSYMLWAHPQGQWIAACQARGDTDRNGKIEAFNDWRAAGGDALRPYLFVGDHEIAVDDFIATDWVHQVVFLREGQLVLLNTATLRERTLASVGESPGRGTSPRMGSRYGGFNRARNKFVYVEGGYGTSRAVVHDLPTGRETRIEFARGYPDGAALVGHGDWLQMRLMSYIPGRATEPLHASRFAESPTAFSCRVNREPRTRSRRLRDHSYYVVHIATQTYYEGVVALVRDKLLLLENYPSGLRWLPDDGSAPMRVSASCSGGRTNLRAAWADARAIEVSCDEDRSRRLYTPAGFIDWKIADAVPPDVTGLGRPDVERGRYHASAICAWKDHALESREDGTLAVRGPLAERETRLPLAGNVPSERPYDTSKRLRWAIACYGRWAVVADHDANSDTAYVIDLQRGLVIGSLTLQQGALGHGEEPLQYWPVAVSEGAVLTVSGYQRVDPVALSSEVRALSVDFRGFRTPAYSPMGPFVWVRFQPQP